MSLVEVLNSIPGVDVDRLYTKFWKKAAQETVYALDGVNVSTGDAYSSIAGDVCRSSYRNSRNVQVSDMTSWNFRGPRGLRFKNLPRWYFQTTVNDWIWTKVWLTVTAGMFDVSAYDVIAMLTSDITRYWGMPLVFSNVLDVSTLWEDIHSPTFLGAVLLQKWLAKVAKDAWLVIFNWETAELGVFVSAEDPDAQLKYNWAWTMQGVYHPDKMILGNKIQDWDVIISLKENGFRSNGISSVRKALAKKFWPEWYKNPDAMPFIKQAATPSVLYDRFLNHLNGWTTPNFEKVIDVHGIVHLSWGAFKWKLFDDLLSPRGLSAELTDLYELPEIMRLCAQWRGMDDEAVYETWNGGQWMIIVVNPKDVQNILAIAADFGIEAKTSGTISKAIWDPSVKIKSALNWAEIEYK